MEVPNTNSFVNSYRFSFNNNVNPADIYGYPNGAESAERIVHLVLVDELGHCVDMHEVYIPQAQGHYYVPSRGYWIPVHEIAPNIHYGPPQFSQNLFQLVLESPSGLTAGQTPGPGQSSPAAQNTSHYSTTDAGSSHFVYSPQVNMRSPATPASSTYSHPGSFVEIADAREGDVGDPSYPLKRLAFGAWKCLICDRILRRKHLAVTHYLTNHAGLRVNCEGRCGIGGCTKSFASRDSLDVHLHPVVVKCPDCYLTISRKNLRRHRKNHCYAGRQSFKDYK